jgi:hypothetical protein
LGYFALIARATLAERLVATNNGLGGNPLSDIFISHVEENSDIAMKIAEGLEAVGYSTWYYERDSLPGPSYLLQTAREIERSKAVVLIISPHALGSHQVTKEVIRAHESGKPFIPVLKSITHVEFGNRQPEWREAVGSATSVTVGKGGVAAILPRILQGAKGLGISPSGGVEGDGAGTADEGRAAPFTQPATPRWAWFGRLGLLPKIALAAGILIFAGASVGTAALIVSPQSSETPAATRTPATPEPTPSEPPEEPPPPTENLSEPQEIEPTVPVADAASTLLETSHGPMRIQEARLVTEACPPQGIPGPCSKTSGDNRYLVLVIAPEGSTAELTQVFLNEGHASVLSFEGRQAGSTRITLQEAAGRIEVVYGILPASSAQGEILLMWPENPPLRLTVTA